MSYKIGNQMNNPEIERRINGEQLLLIHKRNNESADVNEGTSRHGQLNLVRPPFKRETEGGRSFSVYRLATSGI